MSKTYVFVLRGVRAVKLRHVSQCLSALGIGISLIGDKITSV